MRKLIGIVSFVTLFFVCSQSFAAEIVEHKGKLGLWFEESAARALLEKEKGYDLLETKLKLLDLKIDEMEVLLLVVKRQRDLESEIALTWENAFSEENKLRLKEQAHYESIIKEKEKWYRSPVFWGCVGFIVGSAATIAVAYSLENAYQP